MSDGNAADSNASAYDYGHTGSAQPAYAQDANSAGGFEHSSRAGGHEKNGDAYDVNNSNGPESSSQTGGTSGYEQNGYTYNTNNAGGAGYGNQAGNEGRPGGYGQSGYTYNAGSANTGGYRYQSGSNGQSGFSGSQYTDNMNNGAYSYQGYNGPQIPPAHGKAVASLVLGIVGIASSCCYGGICGIVGIILAVMAKNEGNNEGIRTAGFILSIIAAALLVITLLFTIISGIACMDYATYL